MTSICEDIAYKLSAYLDNELGEAEKNRVEAHLENCPSCRGSFRELKKSSDLVSARLSVQPSVDFDKAWQHIEPEIRRRPAIRRYLRAFIVKPGFWIPASAAATVGAAALFFALCLPVYKSQRPVSLSHVESVSSKSGSVMVLHTAKTSQPIIWIMEKSPKEKRP
ncbi:MAG: zf-HC2 domain-containing protein [Desulfobacterales bacterium]|nr:zf-HC2 domain-containing protein [Desulfobacterales bacterium]